MAYLLALVLAAWALAGATPLDDARATDASRSQCPDRRVADLVYAGSFVTAPEDVRSRVGFPGPLFESEGRVVTTAPEREAAPAHALAAHGPCVPLAELRQRVLDGGGSPNAATKFEDWMRMELSVVLTLEASQTSIDDWLSRRPPAGETRAFDHYPQLGDLGSGIIWSPTARSVDVMTRPLEGVRLVLKSDGESSYVVHTAYPVP